MKRETMTTLHTRKLAYAFGIEILDVDLKQELPDETIAEIRQLWNEASCSCAARTSRLNSELDLHETLKPFRPPDYAEPFVFSTIPVGGASRCRSCGWLFEHVVDPLYTYRHTWQRHEVLMWDNRSTMHLALADFAPGAHRYCMRTTILDKPSGYVVPRSMPLDYRRHVACTGAAMTKWHFYKGVSNDWHWYQLDETGDVVASSDGAFDGLDACMRNARAAGFDETAFQVHTPAPGTGTQPRNPQNHA